MGAHHIAKCDIADWNQRSQRSEWNAPLARARSAASTVTTDVTHSLVCLELQDFTADTVSVTYTSREMEVEASVVVIAAAATTEAEAARPAADEDDQDDAKELLKALIELGHDSDQTLLRPGTRYNLTVAYSALVSESEIQPDDPTPEQWSDATSETAFTAFKTTSAPPRTLTQWIVGTQPAPDDQLVFFGERPRLLLSTDQIHAVFDAFDHDVVVTVEAAHGDHPDLGAGSNTIELSRAPDPTMQLSHRVTARPQRRGRRLHRHRDTRRRRVC